MSIRNYFLKTFSPYVNELEYIKNRINSIDNRQNYISEQLASQNIKLQELLGENVSNSDDDCYIRIDPEFSIHKYFYHNYLNLKNTLAKDKSVLFVDIGANHGQSAKLAFYTFNNVKVISYEPLKSCLPLLEKVKLLHPDYEYHNKAMSSRAGSIKINEYTNGMNGLSSSLPLKKGVYYFGKSDLLPITQDIPATTISMEKKLWEQYPKDVSILKIDTQGTELSILDEGRDILKSGYFDALMVEIITVDKYEGQGKYIDLLTFLHNCGFIIFNISVGYREWKNIPAAYNEYGFANEYDFVFVHQNSMSHF